MAFNRILFISFCFIVLIMEEFQSNCIVFYSRILIMTVLCCTCTFLPCRGSSSPCSERFFMVSIRNLSSISSVPKYQHQSFGRATLLHSCAAKACGLSHINCSFDSSRKIMAISVGGILRLHASLCSD